MEIEELPFENLNSTPLPTKTKTSISIQIKNYFLEFCERKTIHGLPFLAYPNLTLFEKCIWFLSFVTSLGFSFYVALLSFGRYSSKNTVVGMERNYHYWNTTLPGVTVCPHKRLSFELYEKFARAHNITGKDKNEFFDFLESLANSTYKNFRSIRHFPSTDRLLEKIQINPENYMKLIYDLTNNNVFNGNDNRPYFEIIDDPELNFCQGVEKLITTRQVLTEYGLCFMTNTYLSDMYTASYFITGQSPIRNESWWHAALKVEQSSYFQSGVSYSFRGFANKASYVPYLHSAYEVMDIERDLGYAILPLHIDVEAMEMVVEEGFEKETTISQRQCRFPHESNLAHFPIYTKNLCIQECRLNLVYKICKCIPHFYPNRISKPKPICSYKILLTCVAENDEFFLRLYHFQHHTEQNDDFIFECTCLQNCQDAIVNPIDKYFLENADDILNDDTIEVSLERLPTTRLKRQIIFSFTDLLVSIGGAMGLFLGFSVLGAIEIVYYFTFRLFCNSRGYQL